MGVSVALVEEGRPVVGAVVAPLLGEAWSAAEGQGAIDREGRRIAVSTHPGSGVVATGFPFRRKDRLPRYLPVMTEALRRFEDLRRAGAASLDLAYVGAGAFDGFFELGLGIWDIAAGALLVREAGGVVTDWSGDAQTPSSSAATSWRAPPRGTRRCSRSLLRNCGSQCELDGATADPGSGHAA